MSLALCGKILLNKWPMYSSCIGSINYNLDGPRTYKNKLCFIFYSGCSIGNSGVAFIKVFCKKVNRLIVSINRNIYLSLWAAYFILTFTFPVLYNRLQDKTFFLYAAICAIGFVFVLKRIKETKGKTLEEMEAVFSLH